MKTWHFRQKNSKEHTTNNMEVEWKNTVDMFIFMASFVEKSVC